MKAFFYPAKPAVGYENPYCFNFKHSLASLFELLDADDRCHPVASLALLRYSFKADVFFLNWIESIGTRRFGFIQFFIALLAFSIIFIRKKKIVWMFHNITPHEGHNWQSKIIYRLLFNRAQLIVAHSKEAEKFAASRAKGTVVYSCHPIEMHPVVFTPLERIDVLIWGTILPYKGIPEFLCYDEIQQSDLKIRVVGQCKDIELDKRISQYTNSHIEYTNIRMPLSDIASLCAATRYVLFPYIGESISSSGALIDTLVFGGTPVGPHRGAFADLQNEGVCITYRSFDELLNILRSNHSISSEHRRKFLEANSWQSFVKKISSYL